MSGINNAALKLLPSKLRTRTLSGGRRLRVVGYDPGFVADYVDKDKRARQAWVAIDIEDPRAGVRLGRLHYGSYCRQTWSPSPNTKAGDYTLVLAEALASAVISQCPADSTGNRAPVGGKLCSYPHLPPGTLVKVHKTTKHPFLSDPSTTSWALGVLVGPASVHTQSVHRSSAMGAFPHAHVLTTDGVEALPVDCFIEVN